MADLSNEYEAPAARPMFITVLCILTFIGSGWGIISAGIKYASAGAQAAALSMSKEQVNSDLSKKGTNDPGSQFAKKMVNSMSIPVEDIRKWALADLAASVLCLIGALMMWQLKKTGFYLYLAGTLLGIVGPILILGGGNFMGIISSVFVGFIGVVFVILYGVNVKYMK